MTLNESTMEGWLNKDFVGRGGGDEIDGGDP